MEYTNVIWDFNGTVLDDLRPCIDVLNVLLERRSLEHCGEDRYKDIFGFPIKSYYEAAGFDFTREDYGRLADEWAELYREASRNSALCPGVREALEFFKSKGVRQIILSATEKEMLDGQLRALGVEGYFDETLALSNLYAFSKVELGKAWVRRARPKKALFIGDTLHDYETARAMGVDCVLITSGHQSKERLLKAGVPVFDNVTELVKALSENEAVTPKPGL